MAIEKPIAQSCLACKTRFTEQFECRIVVGSHHRIELVQMQNGKGITRQLAEGGLSISLLTIGFHDDDASLSTQVLWVETHDVADTYSLVVGILNNQSHLAVSIDVVAGRSDIVVQGIARIGYVGGSDIPQPDVVLNAVEQVEVFGLYGPQGYFFHFVIVNVIVISADV